MSLKIQIETSHCIIVGAGFFGATIAERIATILNKHVLIIEKRPHIGGNCFSTTDPETGIEYHQYGPHIFHTSNQDVWQYINQFTSFNTYRHRVYSQYKNQTYSMPINLNTINKFYHKEFSPTQAHAFIQSEIQKYAIESPKNFEEKAISLIGKPLYDAFIKGYTLKQWQTDPTQLPASIINRLPVRFNYNNDYFNDPYQGIPKKGYTAIFETMLNHPNIHVATHTDFFDIPPKTFQDKLLIYTGPIDRFFNYKYGALGWRTVDFKRQVEPVPDYFGNAVMNFGDIETPYTRVHEFRHYHPERNYSKEKTLLFWESSRTAKTNDDPYYPINTDTDKQLLQQYQSEAKQLKNVLFGGRLGNYKYWDMHHTIASALSLFKTNVMPRLNQTDTTTS